MQCHGGIISQLDIVSNFQIMVFITCEEVHRADLFFCSHNRMDLGKVRTVRASQTFDLADPPAIN